MSDRFLELIDATIARLTDLKESGERFVCLNQENLAFLSGTSRKTISPSAAQNQSRPPQSIRQPVRPGPVVHITRPPSEPLAPAPQSSGPLAVEPALPPAPVLDAAGKEAGMAELRERALVCQKCPHLVRSRKNVVFGVGDIHSPLMFVGEAPGADEDEQGEPFVGKAGQLLTRIIQAMGLQRETVYIANVLKCRPDTPGQTYGNRKPTPDEMKTCLPYLTAQVDLIRPRVLVALGATAVEGLLGKAVAITRLRGQFQSFRGIPVMPTYHPSYLLRNQALSVKREVWEDMLQVMEKLELPISQKQRNYFLQSPPG